MKIETAIWNGKKTRVLAVPSFSTSDEALEFLKEIQKLDKDATLSITSVSQYNQKGNQINDKRRSSNKMLIVLW